MSAERQPATTRAPRTIGCRGSGSLRLVVIALILCALPGTAPVAAQEVDFAPLMPARQTRPPMPAPWRG